MPPAFDVNHYCRYRYCVTSTANNIVLNFKQVGLLLIYEMRKDDNVSISDAMGPPNVLYHAPKVCLRYFRGGGFDLGEKPRSGRPVAVDEKC
ncbi:unnamed protein product [Heligmosomoides polygyrus]|uniref:Uncharacterized protein n=1 Tax=Heligmosomoides polygyrus TaxID=6339 RepID=A0A183FHU6_HELPZ|nr:unnamed protein product [Heligmosomoides polygyrus]